jgi:rod shape-determining protein MreC
MRRLLQLIHYYRAFLLFLVLEFVSLIFLVRFNPYHSASFFYSSNIVSGKIFTIRNNIAQYFSLVSKNEELAYENAWLREQYYKLRNEARTRTNLLPEDGKNFEPFEFVNATVINNSTRKFHNFITINAGASNGIEQGMGVIGPSGIIGKIFSVSENYATISSALNIDVLTSAVIKSDGTFCTARWSGEDPRYINLLYVPRHISVQKGDSVVTSGFNPVFPSDVMIGIIEDVSLKESESFYNVKVALSTDFFTLSQVYVIKNPLAKERNSLEENLFMP